MGSIRNPEWVKNRVRYEATSILGQVGGGSVYGNMSVHGRSNRSFLIDAADKGAMIGREQPSSIPTSQ